MLSCAHSASVPVTPTIDVHCNETESLGCYVKGPLRIHEPVVLNFIDAEKWTNVLFFTIPPENEVSVIPTGIFQRFPRLAEVRISTGLSSITKDNFKDANSLTSLTIRGNRLQTIPSNVFQFATNLEEVDISQNGLTTIEDFAFNGLKDLRYIFIHNNSVTALKRNTFAGAENILALQLERNRIESIEDGAFNLPNLKFIFLSHNRIRALSDNVFAGAPFLFSVVISGNGLTHIGQAFSNLKKITAIILDHNRIVDIDLSKFAKLPELKQLSLKDTGFKLAQWDESEWSGVASPAIYLDLSSNALFESDILARLQHFSNLEELSLAENKFTEIDRINDTKKMYNNIAVLELSGNDFKCDKLREIVTSLRSQKISVPAAVDKFDLIRNYRGVACV